MDADYQTELVLTSAASASFASSASSGASPARSAARQNGDWRYYGGDAGSTKYSPLDRINARQRQGPADRVALEGRQLRPDPEFNLQATPLAVNGILYTTAGTRRNVVAIDGATGETLWMFRLRRGRPGAGGAAPATIAACRTGPTGAATSGSSTSRPAISLIALNAKTGDPIPSFGSDGIVDLFDELDTTRPRDGQIGASSPPMIVRDVAVVGGALPASAGQRRGERAGPRPRLRRADRQAAVDLPHHSAAGRVRQRDLGERLVELHRQHRRSGRRCRPTKSSATSTCRSRRRPTTSTAAIGPATTCSPRASCASTPRPASASGTSSSCTTASGTTTRRRRRSCSTSPSSGKPIKAVAQVTKQAFTYVFDRVDRPAGLADRRAAGAAVRRAGRANRRRRSRSRPSRRRSIVRASRSTI